MEAHTKPDGSKEATILAIVVVLLLIDAPILIYPLTHCANLGIIWPVTLDIGLMNIALSQECFTT